MAKIDLHLHTTFSDGRLTPTEMVQLCAQRGLEVISISDHDSTEGIPEALAAAESFPELTIIPGIELSTDVPKAEIHILGYFIDFLDARLQQILQKFRDGRQVRIRNMVDDLNNLGVKISWNRVKQLSGDGAIGRPHIAQAMVEAGHVKYPREAFDKYIGRGGIAYVERPKLTPPEAIKILIDNGAIPVMAHPTYALPESDRKSMSGLKDILKKLVKAGLAGMEVYYGDYSPGQITCLEKLAHDLKLVTCGGSDYHASGNPDEPEPGNVGPPIETVAMLKILKEQRTVKS
jgi:predicted metal-dependent phosphoesterase TrpH